MSTHLTSSIERAHKKVQQFRAREQAILDAALELLIAHGEDRVTVESIAEHINIGKGTIYKHFRSKGEIYVQLLLDYEKKLTNSLQEALKDSSAAAARIYFEFRLSHPERDRLFQRLEASGSSLLWMTSRTVLWMISVTRTRPQVTQTMRALALRW